MRSLAPALLVALVALPSACATGGGPDRRTVGDAGRDAGGAPSDAAGIDGGGLAGDSGMPCLEGDTRLCTTGCGTMGVAHCTGGFFVDCTAPAEDCNGADDDCDGRTDESVAARACSSSCGGGTESCVSGHWTGCTASMPGTETCNGMDDDCDSRVDEAITRACASACGAGTETCVGGGFVGCTAPSPRAEDCNGVDDDCDTRTDESLTRTCANACGTGGMQVCGGGAWGTCSAPPPPVERCNGSDDDCDGTADDDVQVTVFAAADRNAVRSYQPACPSTSVALDTCASAAHRWCTGSGGCGAVGGAGLLDATSTTVRLACFGNHASSQMVSFASLASTYGDPGFDESLAGSRIAQSYANRFCRDRGSAAGIGPVEHSSGNMYVLCLAADQADFVRYATLDFILAGSCDPTVYPDDFQCSLGADRICRNHGYAGGWGPVEWNDTDTFVVCFR
ncbi:MAG: MopE-related protein [Sandaracinus sp.]